MQFGKYIRLIIILSIMPSIAFAGERGANKLYKQGKYAEAAKEYNDASIEKPNDTKINYNRGNALYQLDSLQSALQEYSRSSVSEDRPISQRSFYNLGNTLFNAGQYEQAAAAYIKSLQLNPEDKDAKYNLELALSKMQEQQQQQEKDQKDQQKQDQKQEQKNKDQQKQDQKQEQKDKDQQNEEKQDQQQQSSPQEQQGQPQQQQPNPSDKGKMSKEDALRILNALQNEEKEVQKQLQRYVGGTRKVIKDW
ncbi:MAG: hypothetical protein CO189_04370 [candidate division Zixibacteria bacterium CG_4_9_14_3_um_filter_46_8]|nr:MAG: hypothetical protein CO189_04370 [candidate division Zixibacteria bacterium CG_4_9_14_3_um_filter_46_8]